MDQIDGCDRVIMRPRCATKVKGKHCSLMEVVGIHMLRWMSGHRLMNRICYEDIRKDL